MKTCKACGLELALSEYYTYRRAGKEVVYYARCKPCHIEWQRNKTTKGQKADIKARYRQKVWDKVAAIKEAAPCADCGVNYQACVMDFDHLGDKKYNIAKMIGRYSFENIKKEIDKCDIVCANCHRIRTWNRRYGAV